MQADFEKLIALYLRLREEKEAIERQMKVQLAPIREKMGEIEIAVQRYMNEHHMTNFRTPAGTAYLKTTTSVSVEDWQGATLPYIIEHQAWELLEKRVNKTSLLEAHPTCPGVSVTQKIDCNIRRS